MAGRPMMTAAATPAAMPMAIASKKSMLWWPTSPPATPAAAPTRPNWPRLIWPAHPVSTTMDTATMAYRQMTVSSGMSAMGTRKGAATATAAARQSRVRRAVCTSRRPRSSRGTGRNCFTVCQLDVSESRARVTVRRWMSSTSRITTSMRAEARLLSPFLATEPKMMMPTAMPATRALPMNSMRAKTAAARA